MTVRVTETEKKRGPKMKKLLSMLFAVSCAVMLAGCCCGKCEKKDAEKPACQKTECKQAAKCCCGNAECKDCAKCCKQAAKCEKAKCEKAGCEKTAK